MEFEAGAMSNSSGKHGVYGRKKVYDREQPFTSWLGCRKEKKALGTQLSCPSITRKLGVMEPSCNSNTYKLKINLSYIVSSRSPCSMWCFVSKTNLIGYKKWTKSWEEERGRREFKRSTYICMFKILKNFTNINLKYQ